MRNRAYGYVSKGVNKLSKITEAIDGWFEYKGNTKDVLAKELGISKPTLQIRLDNPEQFSLGNAKKIAELTNHSLRELVD